MGKLFIKIDGSTYKELMPFREIPIIGRRLTYSQKMWGLYYGDEITAEERDRRIIAHEEQLKSKRKYKKGEFIKSLDILMSQEFVYIHDKIYHHGWFASLQIRLLKKYIEREWICKAIKKTNLGE